MDSDKTNDYLVQTLRFLEICMPINLLAEIKKSTCDELIDFHFGFGMWLRNNILNKSSSLYNYFICIGIEHPDDISSIIIKKFYHYINNT